MSRQKNSLLRFGDDCLNFRRKTVDRPNICLRPAPTDRTKFCFFQDKIYISNLTGEASYITPLPFCYFCCSVNLKMFFPLKIAATDADALLSNSLFTTKSITTEVHHGKHEPADERRISLPGSSFAVAWSISDGRINNPPNDWDVC